MYYKERFSCSICCMGAMTEHHDVNTGYLLDTLLVSESVTHSKHVTGFKQVSE